MRIRYRRPRFVIALLTALAIAPSLASADEVVVMPFRCAVVDGKPVLTPSDEQGHRVLGAKEQRKIKTCSTVDRNHCRQWTAFKFDMDCGGIRVSWMQVFANASEFTRRRVWEQNGSLRVRNTPQRSKRIDDMCARRMGVNQEWWSVNEICDDVSPVNPPTSTDMPAGFAPMVGLDAVFLPSEAIGMPPARQVKTAATQTPKAALPDAQRVAAAAARSEESSKAPVGKTGDAAERMQPAAAERSAPRNIEQVTQPQVQSSTEAKVAPSEPASSVVASETAATQTEVHQPAPRPVVAAPESSSTASEVIPAASEARSATEIRPAIETTAAPAESASDAPAPLTLSSVEEGDHTLAYVIGALASVLLVVTLLLVRWLGRAKTVDVPAAQVRREPPVFATPAPTAAPDVAKSPGVAPRPMHRRESEGTGAGTSVALAPQHHVHRSNALVHPVQRSGVLSIGDRMPNSRTEALELLGMGVASDGNVGSVKKIIDGLRMNWHPDHARDDADRRLREVRLKQINAAWDILGQRAEASSGA